MLFKYLQPLGGIYWMACVQDLGMDEQKIRGMIFGHQDSSAEAARSALDNYLTPQLHMATESTCNTRIWRRF